MFPRAQRLSRTSFPTVARGAGRSTTPHFSLVASLESPGYAVVVSKQVARLSVTRHRLKRQVLAFLHTRTLPPGLIVFARTGAPKLSYEEIRTELEAGLRRVA